MSALANFRDVASAAPDHLRPGVLYRSESPLAGDTAPAGVAWPPGTVVDLRSSREHGDEAHPLAGDGTRIVTLPLSDALAPEVRLRAQQRSAPWARLYLDVLDIAAQWLPSLVEQAAHAETPILLHCAAGKDRTGLAVAVLLTLAGVARPAVEADYRRSAERLSAVHARLDAAAAAGGRTVDPHSGIAPEALAAVLDALGPDPVAFACARGVGAPAVAAWRTRVRRRGAAVPIGAGTAPDRQRHSTPTSAARVGDDAAQCSTGRGGIR